MLDRFDRHGSTDLVQPRVVKQVDKIAIVRLEWMSPSRFPCQWCPSPGPEAASLVTQTSTGSRFCLCWSSGLLIENNPNNIVCLSPGSQLLHPSQNCDLDVERGRRREQQISSLHASAVKSFHWNVFLWRENPCNFCEECKHIIFWKYSGVCILIVVHIESK